jgi:nucleoside-diphosphate-sugar epimerase
VWQHFGGDCPSANVLRLSGIYGPGRLLARIESLRAGEPVAGNPDAWLNLIHVEDAARAAVACANRGTPGAAYLVSDDRPVTRREYFLRLAEVTNAAPPVFSQLDEPGTRSRGLNKRCDNARMKRELLDTLEFPSCHDGLLNALKS